MRVDITCLWPGLARLWLRGEWKGLATALCFTALVNFALVASFIWPELLGGVICRLAWLVIGVAWSLAAWRSWRGLPKRGALEPVESWNDNLFRQAQAEYLNGHWFEAESSLEQLLHKCPTDVDARLMLATLYRHTRRFDEAQRQLGWLQRQPGYEKWSLEIAHERKWVSRLAAMADADEGDTEAAGEASPATNANQSAANVSKAA